MRSKKYFFLQWCVLVVLSLPGNVVYSQENEDNITIKWSGYVTGEFRYFHDDALYAHQKETYLSTAFRPQLGITWNNAKSQLNFTGFGRLNQHDSKRTHVDIRELYWLTTYKNFRISAGIKTIFWGKTESNHLADIINQYDLLEGRDVAHKLGQPMIHSAYSPSWGKLDFYLLTNHRELKFPGEKGRLRPAFPILYSESEYELKNGKNIPDGAIRFSKTVHDFDFAISHYTGTNKLPMVLPKEDKGWFPRYEEINQTAVELQLITGAAIWKAEAINQISDRQTIQAYTIGGEYTFSTIFNSPVDARFFAEYTYDERKTQQISGMTNDLFLALHIAFNDKQGSGLLLASVYDFDYKTSVFRASAERRLGKNWKTSLKYNGINSKNPHDFYYMIRNDSFLEFIIMCYF